MKTAEVNGLPVQFDLSSRTEDAYKDWPGVKLIGEGKILTGHSGQSVSELLYSNCKYFWTYQD